jgi:predicted nucleic acid-binding protein
VRFIDSNVFLYVLIGSPREDYETSKGILKRVEDGDEEGLTSLAVLQEVVDWLEYNGRKKEVKLFLTAVNSYAGMKKSSNMWRDFPKACLDVERYGMDFVDGLTLQVMKREGIREIYSNDKDFDRVEWTTRVFH